MHLNPSSSIIVLTGAGISAESGVQTFRGAGGLWEGHRIEDVASPEGFQRNPAMVNAFYNQRRAQLGRVEPNAAHEALARLERAWPGEFLLVTQNVDDLHDRAGSRRLIHLHGELRKVRCMACEAVHGWEGPVEPETRCPRCQRQGLLRPHIVWFGEMPFELDRIYEALPRCGLFVSIGTSSRVYPASEFVAWTSPSTRTVEINLEATGSTFLERRIGKATTRVPELVNELLADLGSRS